MEHFYPIGTPGKPWTQQDKQTWFDQQTVSRSYADEVISRLPTSTDSCEVFQYGALSIDPEKYKLFAAKLPSTNPNAPWVLITGGVHGYETSGVQGALEFLNNHVADYSDAANIVVAPCVSPWCYETVNRWNPNCLDPNRSFKDGTQSQEAASLMAMLKVLNVTFLMHMDLHETTDTDESEFRPALAARDGEQFEPGQIPDGFYTVGDTLNPQPEFQAAIINGVKQVTHIAPTDANGQIIDGDATQPGVINYEFKQWGLCAGATSATYTTTTEVYPDSPNATDEICIAAQVAAVKAGLAYALANQRA